MEQKQIKGNGYGQDPKPEHGNDDKGHNGSNGNHNGQEKKPSVPHSLPCIGIQ